MIYQLIRAVTTHTYLSRLWSTKLEVWKALVKVSKLGTWSYKVQGRNLEGRNVRQKYLRLKHGSNLVTLYGTEGQRIRIVFLLSWFPLS
jgi:hypothetical protein